MQGEKVRKKILTDEAVVRKCLSGPCRKYFVARNFQCRRRKCRYKTVRDSLAARKEET